MAEHRPFPPSPRRRALARQAGLHAASPLLVGAVAAAALLAALAIAGPAIAGRLSAALSGALRGGPRLPARDLAAPAGAIAALALPVVGAAALAAVIAQLVQTRAVWLPRRRVAGAPSPGAGGAGGAGPGPRAARAAGALAAAAAIGGAALAWLWWAAPRLAALLAAAPTAVADAAIAPSPLFAGSAALLTQLSAVLAVTAVALGILDAVLRHAALAGALRMTAAEQREDDRLAGADPRWRARRAAAARGPAPGVAVAGASVVVLGDDAAVAIAWDPIHRPVPARTATGRGPRAAQLVGLARRHRIAIQRDPALAAALVDGDGPVPEHHWPRLAEIVAATRGQGRTPGEPL